MYVYNDFSFLLAKQVLLLLIYLYLPNNKVLRSDMYHDLKNRQFKQENSVNEFHAQRFHFHKDYIPNSAMQNRKQKQFFTELPQGQQYFMPSRKKQFINLNQRSEIRQWGLLNQGDQFPTNHNNLSTADIEGAATNTLISQAVKNKIKNLKLTEKNKRHRNAIIDNNFHLKNYGSQKYITQPAQFEHQIKNRDQQFYVNEKQRSYRFKMYEAISGKQSLNQKYKQRNNSMTPIVNNRNREVNFHIKNKINNRLNSEESIFRNEDSHDILDKFSNKPQKAQQIVGIKDKIGSVSNRAKRLSISNNLYHQTIKAQALSHKNMPIQPKYTGQQSIKDNQKKKDHGIQQINSDFQMERQRKYVKDIQKNRKQEQQLGNYKYTRMENSNKGSKIIQIEKLGEIQPRSTISYAKNHLHKKLWQPNIKFNSDVQVWNPTFIPQRFHLISFGNQSDQYSRNGVIANPY